MSIIPVENTKEIRGSAFIGVQAKDDTDAQSMLDAIATRRGVTVTTVYKWGSGYYYAAFEAK
jgi:hypothetical protein